MLCCLAVRLQVLGIGVTTNSPEGGPVPQGWDDIDRSNQYWYVDIECSRCTAWHKGQERVLQWVLDHLAGNTVGCHVLQTGELHLYHDGRDVGVARERLPTDQPLWGFVAFQPGHKVEANYMCIIPNGEAVLYCATVFHV